VREALKLSLGGVAAGREELIRRFSDSEEDDNYPRPGSVVKRQRRS